MPRGRPPKPLNVLEMSGAVRKNPGRYRARKAAAKKMPPLGAPPAAWTEGAQHNGRFKKLLEFWEELVEQDVLQVLNVSHRILVKYTCLLQYQIEQSIKDRGRAPAGDYGQVEKNLAKMGMTPVDSKRVEDAIRVPGRASESAAGSSGDWGKFAGRA